MVIVIIVTTIVLPRSLARELLSLHVIIRLASRVLVHGVLIWVYWGVTWSVLGVTWAVTWGTEGDMGVLGGDMEVLQDTRVDVGVLGVTWGY